MMFGNVRMKRCQSATENASGLCGPNILQDFPDDVRQRGLVRGDESYWEMQVMREGREMSSGWIVCVVIPEHQVISLPITVKTFAVRNGVVARRACRSAQYSATRIWRRG